MPPTEMRLPRSRRPVPTSTRMRTRSLPVALYVTALVLIVGVVVGGAMARGLWSTAGHGGGQSASKEGAAPSELSDPADVRGSMTVDQVAEAFAPVTAAQIVAAFGAPAGTPGSTPLRELVQEGAEGSGMDIPAFRTWLAQQVAAAP